MITNILFSATQQQLEALLRWHEHEAAHATSLPERADHLRAADDLQRRLSDHHDRTEVAA